MNHSQQLENLQINLERMENVVVAFSGGADSSFLAHVAHNTLGSNHCHVVQQSLLHYLSLNIKMQQIWPQNGASDGAQ